ncbi:MAG TPA: capsular biosynthesis protein, partial [Lachnospiraceae bacterium]|nr:capsular biosynthesis protein [Lachnospiraceae bacterium]
PVTHGILFFSAVGAAIGLLAAMALITVTYVFNDDIVTPEDVENKVGLRVLASLPLEESEDL